MCDKRQREKLEPKRMRVCLTVDVECYSGDYEREVFAGGLGLPFILETLARHDVRGTFFVEALGATRWGGAGVSRVCEAIKAGGHEIGLHVHPVVAKLPGFADQDDKLARHPLVVQQRLIETGLACLREYGGVEAKVFRAGDLSANEDTVRAMLAAGIRIGSNRDLDTKSSVTSELNDWFPVRNDVSERAGVVDVPVTALRSPFPVLDGRCRHLQVTAVGAGEMVVALRRLAEVGYACATILTHPGEFCLVGRGVPRPNVKNRRRFLDLLETVGKPGGRTKWVEMSAVVGLRGSGTGDVYLPWRWSLWRLVEQAMWRVCSDRRKERREN